MEPFRTTPASLVVLPDGRLVIPETEGVWLHVVSPTGRGLTRLGGKSPAALGTSQAEAGKFLSLSGVALTSEGRLLAADRTSNVVSVFSPALEPESTLAVPEARSVWQVEAMPGGKLAAAVSPRRPGTGGQIVLFTPGEPARSYFPQPPITRHNRWQTIASTRMEVVDGRILAYWAIFPWVKVVAAGGDSLPPIRTLSKSYLGPTSGPVEGAPLDELRRWYGSFTPLVVVESAGGLLVFQFLSREGETPASHATSPLERRTRRDRLPSSDDPRHTFVNLHDLSGRRIASDLPLPPGSRVLKSNDPSRLYVLRTVSPRALGIEIWRPKSRKSPKS